MTVATGAEALEKALHMHQNLKTYELFHAGKKAGSAYLKLRPDGTRYLLLDRSREHFGVRTQGLGVDLPVWKDALERGIGSVIMVYHGEKGLTIYYSTVSTWRSEGVPILDHKGFDPQVQLPIESMEVLEPSG